MDCLCPLIESPFCKFFSQIRSLQNCKVNASKQLMETCEKPEKCLKIRSLREISCEIERLKAIRRNGHWFRREKESRERSWNGVILPARSAGSVDLFPFSFPFVFSSLRFAGQSLCPLFHSMGLFEINEPVEKRQFDQ